MSRRFISEKPYLLIGFFLLAAIGFLSILQVRDSRSSSGTSDKRVVGWLELVDVYPGELNLRAKLDTGAKHSSLNAANLEFYERNGEKWVRFSVSEKNGKTTEFREKVVRTAVIKERNGSLTERPVITLWFCLGDKKNRTEVNLVNRSGFNYQLLLGRSFLNGIYIVDVSRKFTTRPSCDAGMK